MCLPLFRAVLNILDHRDHGVEVPKKINYQFYIMAFISIDLEYSDIFKNICFTFIFL